MTILAIFLYWVYRRGFRKGAGVPLPNGGDGIGADFDIPGFSYKLWQAISTTSTTGVDLESIVQSMLWLSDDEIVAVWNYWNANYSNRWKFPLISYGNLMEAIDSNYCNYYEILWQFNCSTKDELFTKFRNLNLGQ